MRVISLLALALTVGCAADFPAPTEPSRSPEALQEPGCPDCVAPAAPRRGVPECPDCELRPAAFELGQLRVVEPARAADVMGPILMATAPLALVLDTQPTLTEPTLRGRLVPVRRDAEGWLRTAGEARPLELFRVGCAAEVGTCYAAHPFALDLPIEDPDQATSLRATADLLIRFAPDRMGRGPVSLFLHTRASALDAVPLAGGHSLADALHALGLPPYLDADDDGRADGWLFALTGSLAPVEGPAAL